MELRQKGITLRGKVERTKFGSPGQEVFIDQSEGLNINATGSLVADYEIGCLLSHEDAGEVYAGTNASSGECVEIWFARLTPGYAMVINNEKNTIAFIDSAAPNTPISIRDFFNNVEGEAYQVNLDKVEALFRTWFQTARFCTGTNAILDLRPQIILVDGLYFELASISTENNIITLHIWDWGLDTNGICQQEHSLNVAGRNGKFVTLEDVKFDSGVMVHANKEVSIDPDFKQVQQNNLNMIRAIEDASGKIKVVCKCGTQGVTGTSITEAEEKTRKHLVHYVAVYWEGAPAVEDVPISYIALYKSHHSLSEEQQKFNTFQESYTGKLIIVAYAELEDIFQVYKQHPKKVLMPFETLDSEAEGESMSDLSSDVHVILFRSPAREKHQSAITQLVLQGVKVIVLDHRTDIDWLPCSHFFYEFENWVLVGGDDARG